MASGCCVGQHRLPPYPAGSVDRKDLQGTLWQQCGSDRRLGLREASIVQAKDEEKDDT